MRWNRQQRAQIARHLAHGRDFGVYSDGNEKPLESVNGDIT